MCGAVATADLRRTAVFPFPAVALKQHTRATRNAYNHQTCGLPVYTRASISAETTILLNQNQCAAHFAKIIMVK